MSRKTMDTDLKRVDQGQFKKHIATVFIRGNLNVLERKIWNLLTKNAFYSLNSKQKHKVELSVLCESAGYNSNDLHPIKDALECLSSTPIQWISEGKNGEIEEDKEWVTTAFLSGAKIKGGIIYYSYSPFLTERLHEPEIYARINLQSQKSLPKGRSLPLYEMTSRYRQNGGFEGKTPKWSLDYFRALMGAESQYYDQFKRLKDRIIKPNVEKINTETDILLETVFHKTGRKYSHVQFLVKNNPQIPLFSQKDPETVPVFENLLKHGISRMQAEMFLDKYPEIYLEEKIKFLESKINKGQIKSSSGGYLSRAIKEDWKEVNLAEDKKEKEKAVNAEKCRVRQVKEREEKEARDSENRKIESERGDVKRILSKLSEERIKEVEELFYVEEIKPLGLLEKPWRTKGIHHFMIESIWREYILENHG